MKAVDTNVLVRYIVQDDPKQSAVATRFVEKTCSKEEPAFINHIVLCEMVWVLESCYGQSRTQTLKVLEQVLRVAQFRVEDAHDVWRAVEDYRHSRADFADHMLARINQAHGCEVTFTFDSSAASAPGFRLLH